MRRWRNWQTRTFEVRVVYPWGFKSPPSHQKPEHIVFWFFCCAEERICSGADRRQWRKQGSEAGAALRFFKARSRAVEKSVSATRDSTATPQAGQGAILQQPLFFMNQKARELLSGDSRVFSYCALREAFGFTATRLSARIFRARHPWRRTGSRGPALFPKTPHRPLLPWAAPPSSGSRRCPGSSRAAW